MIQIKPKIRRNLQCPICKIATKQGKIIWQGIHVGVTSKCTVCNRKFVHDLKIGQATMTPYTICPNKKEIFGEEGPAKKWFADPFLQAMRKPSRDKVRLTTTVHKHKKKVILINCLDYLYGHSLLKLLNTQRHLRSKKYGVIVIIPSFLAWMVPQKVAEIWTVDIPLSQMKRYYPLLEIQIEEQLKRFDEVQLSEAWSHPIDFSIETFTKQTIHTWDEKQFRVTFIWREDRPWNSQLYATVAARKIGALQPFIFHQRLKVLELMKKLKKSVPQAKLTVAGLGTSGSFPAWIDDQRVARFTPEIEQKLVQVYAESRVVVGVHGSNLLLPSAHAGSAISLLPDDRLGNIAQDLLYQQPITHNDPRLYSFYYRYLPITSSTTTVAKQITSMATKRDTVERIFTTRHIG
jgi:hypothetical protein